MHRFKGFSARSFEFMQGLKDTVDWYVNNESWWRPLKSGEYLDYYKKQYGTRLENGS